MPIILHTSKFQEKETTCFCGCLCELHYEITCFFISCEKKNSRIDMFTSRSLLRSLEIPLFSSCDLTCLNFFEFILPKEKKIQTKFDFLILRWINHKTPPLSLSLSFSLKQDAIFTKYRKSDIFNTEYWFSCYLSFSNHNDKISVLSS